MKTTTNNLSFVKHVLGKILFSSQVIILGASLPTLYYVGITHNEKRNEITIIKTNKGKTIMQVNGVDSKTVPYSSLTSNADQVNIKAVCCIELYDHLLFDNSPGKNK